MCNQGNCLYFHNILKLKNILDCPNITNKLHGLTIKQLITFSLLFKYYNYKNILTYKRHIVDVVNAIFGKNYEMQQNNIYIKPLLETLNIEDADNIIMDDNSIFKNILSENKLIKKYNLFIELKNIVYNKYNKKEHILYNIFKFDDVIFSDFQSNVATTNQIIKTDNDKKYLINIYTNIYKIILQYPNHTNLVITKDMLSAIKVKVNNIIISKKEPNYLKGDYDEERYNALSNEDNLLLRYLATIDSYQYIYKKINIDDIQFQLLLELYDYLDTILDTLKNNKNKNELYKFFTAKKNNILKTININFNMKIEDIIQEINSIQST